MRKPRHAQKLVMYKLDRPKTDFKYINKSMSRKQPTTDTGITAQ